MVGTMLQTGYETLRCLRGIDYKWRLVYKTFGFLVSIASIFSLFLVRRWLPALCRDTSAMRASDDFIP